MKESKERMLLILKKKDNIEIKPRKGKVIAAIILLLILIAAYIMSFTPLVQNYWVNYCVILIVQNTMNILFLDIILCVLYIAEKKIILKKIEEYDERWNKKHG